MYSAVGNGRTTVTRCLPPDSRLLADTRLDKVYEATDDVEPTSFANLAIASIEFLIVVLVIVAYCSRRCDNWAPPQAAPIVHAAPVVHAAQRPLPICGNVLENRIVEI